MAGSSGLGVARVGSAAMAVTGVPMGMVVVRLSLELRIDRSLYGHLVLAAPLDHTVGHPIVNVLCVRNQVGQLLDVFAG